jgi:GT2 family glycosyltransferase
LYLLITRVRDEAKYLPALLRSVSDQTIRPALWVLVDHGSRDDSPALIAGAIQENSWIKSVHLPADEVYGLFCHARPLKFGFDFAVASAAEKGIPYEYLGVLDADIVAEPAYFEKLIGFMESSSRVGITSGRLYIEKGGHEVPEDEGKIPRGGCRLYRRACFESIGGTMPESAIWDSETDVLADLRGWQVTSFLEARAVHKRPTSSRKGFLRGYWRLGKIRYYAYVHPVNILLTGILFTGRPPFVNGLVFIVSYLQAWLTRGERTQNRLVKRTLGRFSRRSGK